MKQPIWIDERDALAIHERLLTLHGGATGVRDTALLESALARARQLHAYSETADVIQMAAAYVSGIVRNHPLVDGNKRTGFVTGVLFLELNGLSLTASEEDATQAVLGLAAGSIDEAGFTGWLRQNSRRRRSTQ